MTVALLVLTNGRDELLERTLASFDEQVAGTIVRRVLHDDTGDRDHLAFLRQTYGQQFHEIIGHTHQLGQDKAITAARQALSRARRTVPFDFVFWLEDDFEFQSPVDLDAIGRVLADRPYLLQLALKRQPWWANEVAAGGTFDRFPDDYPEVHADGATWCEHRKWFTHNPNLQRASLLDKRYPTGAHHEWRFSRELADSHRDIRFGYWGERDAPPVVEHLGAHRVGTGY